MTTTKRKNKNAAQLAKLGASKGGKARAAVLSPEERSEIARNAVRTRWAREKGQPMPTQEQGQVSSPLRQIYPSEPTERVSHFHGEVTFGDITMPCHVLNDGNRVIAQREVIKALSGQERPSGTIARLIGVSPIANYIDAEDVVAKALRYRLSGAGHQMESFGYEATLLIEVCEAFLRARDDGNLSDAQLRVARRADAILRACAKVGIIALIDEATGYQEVRQRNALQLKLQAFIADDMQEWAKLFSDEFWLELARLEHTRYSPRSRPLRWGKYVMAFVYDAVDKDVGQELRRINSDPHFRRNHHQWLKEFGRGKVRDHINQVIGVMKLCRDMDEFNEKFGYVFRKDPMQLSFFDIVDVAD